MLSPKVFRFGIKGIIPYDRDTYKPLGFAEVISSGGLELTGEMVSLQGGSNRYNWESAHGFIEPKATVGLKELPSWVYSLMLGVTPEVEDVSDAGKVVNITNRKGTPFATDGDIFTGVTISDGTELKFGTYTVEITAADAVTVYAATDVDAGEGKVPLKLQNDILRINADTLELKASTNIELTQLGVTLAVGTDISGAVIGDTFTFEILPKADYLRRVTIGRSSDKFPVFGMYFVSENIENASLCLINCFKCKANGFPQTMTEKSWAESELTIMPVIDGSRGVCEVIDIIRK